MIMAYTFVLGLLFSSVVAGQALYNGSTVRTSSGPVNGHVMNGVTKYLGIPYAQPPTGALRFQPPQAFNGTAVINGSSIDYACPAVVSFAARGNDIQNYNVSLANLTAQGIATISAVEQVGATFSEDCLTLNIWVPAGGETKKAVMIWIHGGGFTSGSTQISIYNGQHLAALEDVIVVTMNYRLDIFGFPGDPSAENRNPGLLDQRLGVEWVRDNIAAFGGDPARLTLFGQSAGSLSVDYYTYAWKSDPIVAGFIMQSGTVGTTGPGGASSAAAWYNASEAVGCGGNDNSSYTSILSCMQSKNVWEILAAMGNSSFGPSPDGITVFENYTELQRAGEFAQKPVLLGNNDFEAGVFIALDALVNETHSHTYWEAFTNSSACYVAARANVSYSVGAPVWRYRWFGNFPDTRLYTNPDSGAYHGSEMPFIFDTLPQGPGIPPMIGPEVAIGEYIRGAWAAFAKNPTMGLSNYKGSWPLFDPYEDTLVRLAWNNQTGPNQASPWIYDSSCNQSLGFLVAKSPLTDNGTAPSSTGPVIVATSTGGSLALSLTLSLYLVFLTITALAVL